MFTITKPFFIHAITSLHCGSGNDLGIIDLPIQREKHTGFPKVESSSLKGSLREAFENNKEDKKKKLLEEELKKINSGKELSMLEFNNGIKQVKNYDYAVHLAFGYDEDYVSKDIKDEFVNNSEFSGCLGFTDARILLFPVKSVKGVFAWVTCPYVLKRFSDDLKLAGQAFSFTKSVNIGECIAADKSHIAVGDYVILEEYSFKLTEDKSIASTINKYINIPELEKKLVILSDDDFKDFVNLSTEVITRTKIDNETGTVKNGALFNEEYLPPETIMYYLVFASPVFQKDDNKKGIFKKNGKSEEELVFEFFKQGLPEVIQLGGNATIGKGIIKTKMMEVQKNA